MSRHRIDYSYACKICYIDKDPVKIILPDGVDTDKFAEILSNYDLTDVGVICVMKTKTVYDLHTTKFNPDKTIYTNTKTLNMYLMIKLKPHPM